MPPLSSHLLHNLPIPLPNEFSLASTKTLPYTYPHIRSPPSKHFLKRTNFLTELPIYSGILNSWTTHPNTIRGDGTFEQSTAYKLKMTEL